MINTYYRIRLDIYLVVNDNGLFHLYNLKSANDISKHCFPWNYLKRFNSEETAHNEIKNLSSLAYSEDISKYAKSESEIEGLIDRYRYMST